MYYIYYIYIYIITCFNLIIFLLFCPFYVIMVVDHKSLTCNPIAFDNIFSISVQYVLDLQRHVGL